MKLSPLRKEQRRYLTDAALCGQIIGGKGHPYKVVICRALVRKGYLSGSLTDTKDVPFTIRQAGIDALQPPLQPSNPPDEYVALLPTGPESTPSNAIPDPLYTIGQIVSVPDVLLGDIQTRCYGTVMAYEWRPVGDAYIHTWVYDVEMIHTYGTRRYVEEIVLPIKRVF